MDTSREIKAVIFDLDGVIVSTDEFHYRAWQQLADEHGIPFSREDNARQRGVSRMESLEVVLEKAGREYTADEKLAMAEDKNTRYREMLSELTPADVLPGIPALLDALTERGIKIAIGSSSKNTPFILERIGMAERFDAVSDGNNITHSKPHPEVFLIAAERLGIPPESCAVVEDAVAGIDAALAAGMRAVAVGYAAGCDKADYAVELPGDLNIDGLLRM
jgi:beta-phosphoglucomutase